MGRAHCQVAELPFGDMHPFTHLNGIPEKNKPNKCCKNATHACQKPNPCRKSTMCPMNLLCVMILSALLFLPLATPTNFVKGSNCGIFTEIKTMEKLPEDFSQLECVIVKDSESFKRYIDSQADWGNYSKWSPCTALCNGGLQWRTRICKNATHQLDPSLCGGGQTLLERKCNTEMCIAHHGGWSDWTFSGPCQAGMEGNWTRSCDNPPPSENPPGDDCVGPAWEVALCPVHGGWSAWQIGAPCSQTCGSFLNVRIRTRACDNPEPSNGGLDCVGQATDQTVPCDLPVCDDEPCTLVMPGVVWYGQKGYGLSQSLSFFDAQESCHSIQGGTGLITIQDQEEHGRINSTLHSLGFTDPNFQVWVNHVNDGFLYCNYPSCPNLYWQDKTLMDQSIFSKIELRPRQVCVYHSQTNVLKTRDCTFFTQGLCELECAAKQECPKNFPYVVNNGSHCCENRYTADSGTCTTPIKATDPLDCCDTSLDCPSPPCVSHYLANEICDQNMNSRKINGENGGVIMDPLQKGPNAGYIQFGQHCTDEYGGTPLEITNLTHSAAVFYILKESLGSGGSLHLPIDEPAFSECSDSGECYRELLTNPARWSSTGTSVNINIFVDSLINKALMGTCVGFKVYESQDILSLESVNCSDSLFRPCYVSQCQL